MPIPPHPKDERMEDSGRWNSGIPKLLVKALLGVRRGSEGEENPTKLPVLNEGNAPGDQPSTGREL